MRKPSKKASAVENAGVGTPAWIAPAIARRDLPVARAQYGHRAQQPSYLLLPQQALLGRRGLRMEIPQGSDRQLLSAALPAHVIDQRVPRDAEQPGPGRATVGIEAPLGPDGTEVLTA